MPNIPGWAWPEAACFLNGSVLHVSQARWKQRDTFVPLVEPAKWMVAVYVDGALVYGQVPDTASLSGTGATYADEMPLSQKTFTLDLAGEGVHESHPLSPLVRVDQYAGTSTGGGTWLWRGNDWELGIVPSRILMDSNAGVPKAPTYQWTDPETDPWIPLSMGYYDEGYELGEFVYERLHNVGVLGAPDGSIGFIFQCVLPYQLIHGIQVWIPPWELPPCSGEDIVVVPNPLILRLWEGDPTPPNDNVVRTVELDDPRPGWNNVWFQGAALEDPTPYEAETQWIPDTPGPGDPYPYKPNPVNDGWYIVGWQTEDGFLFRGPGEAAYKPYYPEVDKSYMHDNSASSSNLINAFAPVEYRGPEWAPAHPAVQYLYVAPIVTYRPIYPVPSPFVPQVYRRVVTEAS